jgi:hypothetical protein
VCGASVKIKRGLTHILHPSKISQMLMSFEKIEVHRSPLNLILHMFGRERRYATFSFIDEFQGEKALERFSD